ncbi:ABC transporter ATP-binding protein [Staphylothermus hellenicus]|uniref:Nickel import system ATP-binding protein NikD n=1 Tax=Staphylothermus hellenicus (strain DSM 12710 / JCM 10830 / BK20S6-10-b1 / P8) TaxID=591019 RepID=D7D868_STAHD|nr:ABC transporter ATP-binding protein [Staphylothermus hellenicus]ADI31964.1 oligopeptide/dipeptide ABC transporter, ATPase subunit [Staphylothermus hellenicus DSM 12710]
MALISIRNLSIHYYTLSGIVHAVDNVSFDILEGEWISIVGESGSGKSTLAYSIIGLVPPPGRIVTGEILFNGRNLVKLSREEMRRIRGKDIGMVFQDPMTSLDPLRRVGDQIAEVFIEHGVLSSWKEARERARELLKKVGLPGDRASYYPHQLSGGQRQRIAIAIAMALKPKLLIADEPTTALDVIVQDTIMDLMEGFKKQGTSILFITHDLALAAEHSDRIAVMYAGKLVELGSVDQVIDNPLHPYTIALIKSVPDLWGEKKIKSIPGYLPDLRNPPRGCRFHPRCPFARDICRREEPEIIEVEKGHIASCHLLKKR